jgi:hypothetical protein
MIQKGQFFEGIRPTTNITKEVQDCAFPPEDNIQTLFHTRFDPYMIWREQYMSLPFGDKDLC